MLLKPFDALSLNETKKIRNFFQVLTKAYSISLYWKKWCFPLRIPNTHDTMGNWGPITVLSFPSCVNGVTLFNLFEFHFTNPFNSDNTGGFFLWRLNEIINFPYFLLYKLPPPTHFFQFTHRKLLHYNTSLVLLLVVNYIWEG